MACIAVVTSHPPLAEGGHLVIATELVSALREAGHAAGLITTPQNRFGRQGAAYLATWLTDVGRTYDDRPIDQVISLRYPAYAVRHPRHVCWLNHTMREYYDRWPAFSAGLSPQGRMKERVRRAFVHAADGYLLRRLSKLLVQSETVQDRLRRWGGLASAVLHPPPPRRPYRCDGYGDYLFAVSRLTPLKRMSLVIDALAQPAAAGIRCVIAGDGEEADALRRRAAAHGLDSRVSFAGRIDEAALLDHLAHCRAVCFTPLDEDYGFVTVEAFAARKAVLTCRDSGGPAELVDDGQSGLVCDPDPAALAATMRRVMDDEALAERLGDGGFAQTARMTWAAAVERLVLV